MDKDLNKKFIMEVREMQYICDRAMRGEEVNCPECGEKLLYYGLNSGKHPAVYCPNNDFKVLMDFKEENIIEKLGLDKSKKK
ncbi:hypothetical protein SAMN04487969_108134 [Paenibacillus algorifonticola]|uniref:Uncharacterized protein n=1 Tax=Paenibacillus algorifonticola TaxID=684063 RepID=A0A1I2E2I0_9BACL|nr:hypothetical protein [Paenibacillus algorifonticola]SFE86897.1 hypothetical protein SAMN04487969_108134 [Paenibacillus algorifonticola]